VNRRTYAEAGVSLHPAVDPGVRYVLDRSGVIRARQIGGPMTDQEFQNHYDKIH